MGSINDFPERHSNHDLGETAELALVNAIGAERLFLVQQQDRHDYGTDITLEARSNGSMTNVRVHVQLKGTESVASADGSVAVQVARRNLNYLLMQPDSVYVCFHVPTGRLLAKLSQDVFRDYEHRGGNWQDQAELTVRFSIPFDARFQQRLHARVLARGRATRSRRLDWIVTPPSRFPNRVQQSIPQIEVPTDAGEAMEALRHLYTAGHDRVISASFEQFAAVLGDVPGGMDMAYMSEINLGINDDPFDKDRVRDGIQAIEAAQARGTIHMGSLLYCEGNAWLALQENEKAIESYSAAIAALGAPELAGVAAQCCKNWGSALENLGRADECRALYERALEYDPDLNEAHFALGVWHLTNGNDAELALKHLDSMSPRRHSPVPLASLQGRRIEALFKLGDVRSAFREIQGLRNQAAQHEWVSRYCARMVAAYGRMTGEAATLAAAFWRTHLRDFPDDDAAERERLFCLSTMRFADIPTGIDFESYRDAAVRLIECGDTEAALLWDRVGHWAQNDGNWVAAESSYRRAFQLEPERYGYCLGTALNFLDRHAEALPILLSQAEEHQPDARSWFQVAVAREGVGDIQGCIAAYRRAIELDEEYELAWFNLGGVYWNARNPQDALDVWSEALRRFPEHEAAKTLRAMMSDMLGEEESEE